MRRKSKKPKQAVLDKVRKKAVSHSSMLLNKLRLAEKQIERLDLAIRSKFGQRLARSENLTEERDRLHKVLDQRNAELAKLRSKDRLETLAVRLQKKIQNRDSRIAELQKTPAGEVYRLKKRLEGYKQEVQERDAAIAKFEQTISAKFHQYEQDVYLDYDDLGACDYLHATLDATMDSRHSLLNSIDHNMDKINNSHVKLIAKLKWMKQVVADLQQEAKVYYDAITDPSDFIRQVYEKTEKQITTIEHDYDEFKVAAAKYYPF